MVRKAYELVARYGGSAVRLLRTARREGTRSAWARVVHKYAVTSLPPRVPALPRIAELGISSRCNLRCKMCRKFLPRFPDAPIGYDMSLDQFRTVLDHCPTLEEVWVRGGGEPLMNPELISILREAKARGIRMVLFTSVVLLTEALCRGFIEVGLDGLIFSVDGASAQTYERIRQGARFDRVMEKIALMVKLKSELAAQDPYISVMWIVMKENVDELGDALRLFSDMGIPSLFVKSLNPMDDDSLRRDIISREQYERLPQLKPLAEQLGIELLLPRPSRLHYPDRSPNCRRAWEAPLITAAGDVSPCPYHRYISHMRYVPFGNVFRQTLAQVWNAPPYREFRSQYRRSSVALCGGCPEA